MREPRSILLLIALIAVSFILIISGLHFFVYQPSFLELQEQLDEAYATIENLQSEVYGFNLKLEETREELEGTEEEAAGLKRERDSLRELLTLALTGSLLQEDIGFGSTPESEVVVATLGNVTFTVDPEEIWGPPRRGWIIIFHVRFPDGHEEKLADSGPGPWIRAILIAEHSGLVAGGLYLGGGELHIFVGSLSPGP